MGIETGFQLIKETFTFNTVLGWSNVYSIIILLLIMLIVTRDFTKWKTLTLPTVLMLWMTEIIKMNMTGMIITLIAIILYTTELLGINNMYNATIKATGKAKQTINLMESKARYKADNIQGTGLGTIDTFLANRSIKKENKLMNKLKDQKIMTERTLKSRNMTSKELANSIMRSKPIMYNKPKPVKH